MTLQQLKYITAIADYGSINLAAKMFYVSQPSMSEAVERLEEELGFALFMRSNRGISVTTQGNEFLGYARQVLSQFKLVEERYIEKKDTKKKFSVSMQHYTFAVEAFVNTIKEYDMDEYEFAVYETKTWDVIENVKNFKSELGILYMNSFNEKVILKFLKENNLEFVELFSCKIYVYLSKSHPLAKKDKILLSELDIYPCIAFDQGFNQSFYLAEEVLSTYDYKRIIKVSDRATILNLMTGLNGYTLCSGIISEELNGDQFKAVLLENDQNTEDNEMRIGYIKKKNILLSEIGKKYVDKIEKYKENVF